MRGGSSSVESAVHRAGEDIPGRTDSEWGRISRPGTWDIRSEICSSSTPSWDGPRRGWETDERNSAWDGISVLKAHTLE